MRNPMCDLTLLIMFVSSLLSGFYRCKHLLAEHGVPHGSADHQRWSPPVPSRHVQRIGEERPRQLLQHQTTSAG